MRFFWHQDPTTQVKLDIVTRRIAAAMDRHVSVIQKSEARLYAEVAPLIEERDHLVRQLAEEQCSNAPPTGTSTSQPSLPDSSEGSSPS